MARTGTASWSNAAPGPAAACRTRDYHAAGAQLALDARRLARPTMILKVKEPLPSEYRYLRDGLILFTYLHLAASHELTRALREPAGVRHRL